MELNLQKGGFFLIDKPYTWTSFQTVNKLKVAIRTAKAIKKFKIGHAGTLDPLATGLIVVCFGPYTKKIESFQLLDKVYTGCIHLGATTKSFDLEHEEDTFFALDNINEDKILACANSFIGSQEQVPPTYSAVKIAGKRAFSYAREQAEIDIPTKKINIYSFEIEKIVLPDVFFRISCSKGTYIRSIARDFGQRLDNGAYLKSLRRESIGNYNVTQALTPKQYSDMILNNSVDIPIWQINE